MSVHHGKRTFCPRGCTAWEVRAFSFIPHMSAGERKSKKAKRDIDFLPEEDEDSRDVEPGEGGKAELVQYCWDYPAFMTMGGGTAWVG